jgi:translation initiation factor IF-3
VDCIKQQRPNKPTELVNESIPNVELLVIDETGTKIGIISRREALSIASQREIDLVVVSPESRPMVAKLMDYSKFRYEQQRKLREIKKNQHIVELKEIRLSATIDTHDFDTKLKQTLKFLSKGDKVKLTIRFFGRMITHSDVGRSVMDKFIEAIGTNGTVEARPKMDGRSMIAIIAPTNT